MKYKYILTGFIERLNKHTMKTDKVPIYHKVIVDSNKYTNRSKIYDAQLPAEQKEQEIHEEETQVLK